MYAARMSKVWFSNPDAYLDSLISANRVTLYWSRVVLDKRRIDVHKYMALMASGTRYEYLVEEPFGITHMTEQNGHVATYPTWDYRTDDFQFLEMMCEFPLGNNDDVLLDPKTPKGQRPVRGQKHIIGLTGVPSASSNIVKNFYIQLRDLTEKYDVNFFIPNISSYKIAFGMGFWGAALSPDEVAKRGDVTLPSGKVVRAIEFHKYPIWIKIFGQTAHELKASPGKRLEYNVASAIYAEREFTRLSNWRPGAPTVSTETVALPEKENITPLATLPKGTTILEGDKFTCDTCSLINNCQYAREGEVCSVPESPGQKLSSYFDTRDPDKIVDGLVHLNGIVARRVERGIAQEEAFGELDPEVTKGIGMLHKQGSEVAKLLNPNLRGGAKVQVNVGGSAQVQVGSVSPQEITANIMRELEQKGIAREDQTPELIASYLNQMYPNGMPQLTKKQEIIDAV